MLNESTVQDFFVVQISLHFHWYIRNLQSNKQFEGNMTMRKIITLKKLLTQSVRPSPSSCIAVQSSHNYKVTSSAPCSGSRQLFNNLPKTWANQYTISVFWLFIALWKATGRPSHDVGECSRDTSNQNSQSSSMLARHHLSTFSSSL